MDSPGSPLSEHSDEEFQDHEDYHHTLRSMSGATPEGEAPRPSKRQRLHGPSARDEPVTAYTALPDVQVDEDISSDTDGSVPGSPHLGATNAAGAGANAADDDYDGAYGHRGEQISFCRWDGCVAGELGNMDLLVNHLHDEHIHARQKKYSCEWADCNRKGIPHASGYALRAHMRSHTREKPFYCTLPECDRSFTRSDALAKHMRTVHETEALRPSDPVPKHHSSNPQNKHQKIRLTFKAIGSNGESKSSEKPGSVPASPRTAPTMAPPTDEEYEHNNVILVSSLSGAEQTVRKFPPDVQFTEEELALAPEKLYKVLRLQLKWASEDGEELRREIGELDERRRREWMEKEVTLENVLEAEYVGLERRGAKGPEDAAMLRVLAADVSDKLDIGGEAPWWRMPRREVEGANEKFMEGVQVEQAHVKTTV